MAIQAKGIDSVKVTWVKGHATEEHILKGISTATKKEGNDAADEAADKGTQLYGSDLIDVAHAFHKRHARYLRFMKDVSHHIIEGYLIHRELTLLYEDQDKEDSKLKDKKKPHAKLSYPKAHQTKSIKNTAGIQAFKKYKDHNKEATEVQQFLSNLKVCSISPECRGITWYELYILYRSRGYNKPLKDPDNKACANATADKQIRAFKNNIRNVISRTLQDNSDAHLFNPSKPVIDSLIGVGITGKHTTLNMGVEVNDQEATNIAINLIKLSRTINQKDVIGYINNTKNLIPHELKLKGKTGWDSAIKTLNPINKEVEAKWDTTTQPSTDEGNTSTTFYTCPRCKNTEPSTCTKFQQIDLDIQQKCMSCKKVSPVKSWNCQCGIRWYNCSMHMRCNNITIHNPSMPLSAKCKSHERKS
jgi:hypothetical protein